MGIKKKVTGKELREEVGPSPVEKDRKKEYGDYDKWEVEGWARTLEESIEVMNDPKKLKAVEKCLAKRESSIEKLKAMLSKKDKD